MASKRIYQSQYGGGMITDAAYLVEEICRRIALKDKCSLPMKFWSTESWKKIFLAQMVHANKLLAVASCVEIMAALRHKDLRSVYSLGLKNPILYKIRQLAKNIDLTKDQILLEPENEDWYEEMCDSEIDVEEIKVKSTSLWEKLDG